jgi:hypothetical protein
MFFMNRMPYSGNINAKGKFLELIPCMVPFNWGRGVAA